MTDLFSYLGARPYPGRGILLGHTPAGRAVCAYFIMGRSVNSRNRVFEATEDGIRTRAFDESMMTDPSLIIYHPIRRVGDALIVTNGDQTDTIRDYIVDGKGWLEALNTRQFEPDEPNWTPRVSGVMQPGGAYMLSILKSREGDPACCERFFYTYDAPGNGQGRFISTYEGFGSPLPSYAGEPVCCALPELGAQALADRLWEALDADNRVSLYVSVGGDGVIINKNVREG